MNVRRGATDPLRSGETHPALSSPTATSAFGLGGYASPSQCSRTGKKVKDREIDVAPWFCTGPCASKAANHWQATAPRRARVAKNMV